MRAGDDRDGGEAGRIASASAEKPIASAAPVKCRSPGGRGRTPRAGPGRGPSGSSTIARNIARPTARPRSPADEDVEEAVDVDPPAEEEDDRGREQGVLDHLRCGRQVLAGQLERAPEAREDEQPHERPDQDPRDSHSRQRLPAEEHPGGDRRADDERRWRCPIRRRRPARPSYATGTWRGGRRGGSRRPRRAGGRPLRADGQSRGATILASPCAPGSSGVARRRRSGRTWLRGSGS